MKHSMAASEACQRNFGENAFGKSGKYEQSEYDPDCLQAFDHGGWYFGSAGQQELADVKERKYPGGCKQVGVLCKEADGKLKVALPRMNVRLDPGIDREKIRSALNGYGYTIVHDYPFDPTLFLFLRQYLAASLATIFKRSLGLTE